MVELRTSARSSVDRSSRHGTPAGDMDSSFSSRSGSRRRTDISSPLKTSRCAAGNRLHRFSDCACPPEPLKKRRSGRPVGARYGLDEKETDSSRGGDDDINDTDADTDADLNNTIRRTSPVNKQYVRKARTNTSSRQRDVCFLLYILLLALLCIGIGRIWGHWYGNSNISKLQVDSEVRAILLTLQNRVDDLSKDHQKVSTIETSVTSIKQEIYRIVSKFETYEVMLLKNEDRYDTLKPIVEQLNVYVTTLKDQHFENTATQKSIDKLTNIVDILRQDNERLEGLIANIDQVEKSDSNALTDIVTLLDERVSSVETNTKELDDALIRTKSDLQTHIAESQRVLVSRSTSIDMSRAEVEQLVSDELLRWQADIIAMPDYALASAGAAIESVSPRYDPSLYLHTLRRFMAFDIGSSAEQATVILKSDNSAGNCYPFANDGHGGFGYVTIRLASNINPTAISIDHIPSSLTHNISSAPKVFRVTGIALDNSEQVPLGEYTYNASSNTSPVQTFKFSDAKRPVHSVNVEWLSNHGNEDHTCVYRVRVHGIY